MNSLRSISDLPRLDRQPIAVWAVCLALTQSFFAAREAGFDVVDGARSRHRSAIE
jgi:hypothetical protein